jgi:hypothetical protein
VLGEDIGHKDFITKGSTVFTTMPVSTLQYEQGYNKEKEAFRSILVGDRQAKELADMNSPKVKISPNKQVHEQPSSK